MTARWMYVDVGAARIQRYIGRTRRLKGHRGASSWLSLATSHDELTKAVRTRPALSGVEVNPEAGEADGVVSVRLPADRDPRPVAEELAAFLRSVLPAIELSALWGVGDSYLEAYRDHMKPRRDDPPLHSLSPPMDFPALASCAECRAGSAVDQIDIHEETGIPVCLDCLARYTDRYRRPGLAAQPRPDGSGLPVYREEAELAGDLGRVPIADTAQDFNELAALAGPDTQRNHVATVYVDGNTIGALFDRIAEHGDPGLKARISSAVSRVAREALREATRVVLSEDGERSLPVIPHVVGGDDLVVSVVADRAWRFTVTYLDEFRRRLQSIPGVPGELLSAVPPTASAGLVFTHCKFPFRRAAELAGERLRAAKRQFCGVVPAVAWLDVTRDGERPPATRRAWSLDDLIELNGPLRTLTGVERSGRAVLERLIDPGRPVVSVARLRDHARRLERSGVLEPFLTDADPEARTTRMAGALSVARWWR